MLASVARMVVPRGDGWASWVGANERFDYDANEIFLRVVSVRVVPEGRRLEQEPSFEGLGVSRCRSHIRGPTHTESEAAVS